jgi:hypothetical protein
MRAELLGVAAAGLLVVLAGCATQPEPPSLSGSMDLLDVAELTSEERIDYAEQSLIGDCLRQHGFEHRIVKLPEATATDDASVTEPFLQGIDDVDRAAKQGFRFFDGDEDVQPAPDPNVRYVRGLSESDQRKYTVAYFGNSEKHNVETTVAGVTTRTSTTGCLAEARKQLYGSLEAWFRPSVVEGNVGNLARERAAADPRYLRVVRAWSDCLRERGIATSSPSDLHDRFDVRSAGMPRRSAEKLERRWAVAEAQCARRVELTKVARDVERRHQRAQRAKYRTELERYDQLQAAAADRAQRILRSA